MIIMITNILYWVKKKILLWKSVASGQWFEVNFSIGFQLCRTKPSLRYRQGIGVLGGTIVHIDRARDNYETRCKKCHQIHPTHFRYSSEVQMTYLCSACREVGHDHTWNVPPQVPHCLLVSVWYKYYPSINPKCKSLFKGKSCSFQVPDNKYSAGF